MKKVLLALCALLALGAEAQAQQIGPAPVYCNKFFTINAAAATSILQIVAPVGNQTIYVCGLTLNAGAAAATFSLTAGTGANCNTSPLIMFPTVQLGINGVLDSRSPVIGSTSDPGDALCYTITGTGPLSAVVYYGQF